jgi:hypothetical protein
MERNEMNTMEQEAAHIEEATRFVSKNIVEASDGFVCVDGRYQNDGEQKGFLARAGGHFGIVMGLLALNGERKIDLTVQECFDTVYNFVTQDGGTFDDHTDRHSVDDKTLTGCGHAGRSANPEFSKMFGVNPEDIKKAIEYSRDNLQHPLVRETVLEGNHAEKGVLIVKGTEKTLQHQDANSQYFIYDKDRDDKFVENFIEGVNINGLNADDLKKVLEKQTNATVTLLAAEKPVIEVDLTEEQPRLTFLQMVPPLAA